MRVASGDLILFLASERAQICTNIAIASSVVWSVDDGIVLKVE